jgi:DNA-binding MarR family transcriptional regulator
LRVRSYSVLAIVADGARPTQRELADFLRLDPSQIVAIVDDLEGRHLVERRQGVADRRARIIVATAEGERVYAAARESAVTAERTAHPGLADADRASALALLRTLAFPEP